MSKVRDISGLSNIIKTDANGNVTFVSGSTTLMSISSSGAITTTGVISGSNALSASYAETASFVNLSQTASFVANAQSASNAVAAATASFANAFTVANTLTAQTLVVQTITSSVDFVTGSTRFGSIVGNTHQFTGSVGISGSLSGTSATFSTEVTSAGSQGRFGGWAIGDGYQGNALEVGVSGGTATLLGYNRTSGTYIPLVIGANTNQTTEIGGNIIVLQNNGVERMRITSGGDIRITGGGSTTSATLELASSSTPSSGASIGVSYLGAGSYGPLIFATGGAERIRITSAGNLEFKGISTTTNFQAVFYNANDQFAINATNTGTGKIINFNPSNTFTALSLAANGAATFSSSVTANSLGVGNNTSGFGDVMLISNTNANVYPRVNRSSTSYEAGWKLSTGGTDSWYLGLRSADGVGSYHFYSYTTNTSVVSITNGGNVLMGTTADVTGKRLNINGAWRATITSGGANSSDRCELGDTNGSQLDLVSYVPGSEPYSNSIGMFVNGGKDALIMAGNANIRFVTGGYAERMRITNGGTTQPGADNAYSLGASGIRWSAVWAANGTIQTSDIREKKDIVECDLGLNFVSKLRPVSYKWIVGKNEITSETTIDGEGNETSKTKITPIEGKRTHYGLIAQEVEELLDGKDFGGFIHDEETDIKGLRYDQFVPLLIKAIQEQQAQINELKAQING